MTSTHTMVLFIVSLQAAVARRSVSRAADANSAALDAKAAGTCTMTENEASLGYGVKASYPVKSCMLNCKYLDWQTVTFPNKAIAEPSEGDGVCKCYSNPRYWETPSNPDLGKKFWFQFRTKKGFRGCDKKTCESVFFQWGNSFLKKLHYPGDSERMPQGKLIESQNNYAFKCAEGIPEGIFVPSPDNKINELRLQIENTDDPDEKARLQALLDDLLSDKSVEVFAYDLEGDWGPEIAADSSLDGELHSYQLKPCKSNDGREITDTHEIYELCGPAKLGETMQAGKLRVSYDPDAEWGPEQAVKKGDNLYAPLLEAAFDSGELLSFRLKPCRTKGGQEVTALKDVLDQCGKPEAGFTFLPVMVSAAHKYDADAPQDELPFPCP